jgi:2-polyprenyl-3-methyl-5-hydroxy-6-metoxy-1,4-benzoquinol methylase
MKRKIDNWESTGNKHLNMAGNKIPLPYHKVISDLVVKYSKEGDDFLDIGCGIGQLCALVDEKSNSTRHIHIADAYPICLEETATRITPASQYHIDEKDFDIVQKIDKKFDVVVMSHVLEHMLNPVQAVKDALSLVKEGGHLIMAVPNPARPNVLISNITKTHYVNRGHVVTWDMSHWINFLENILGLNVVEYQNDYIQIKGCNSVPVIMKFGEMLGKFLPWWCFSNIAVIKKENNEI